VKELIQKIMGEPHVKISDILFVISGAGAYYVLTDSTTHYTLPPDIRFAACGMVLFISTVFITYSIAGDILTGRLSSIFSRKK